MELLPRLVRETQTIAVMVKIYCHNHHNSRNPQICEDCTEFLKYAEQRLLHCAFGEQKPTCGKCTIHCYKKEMQVKAKSIMRYSGPRMLWNHPLLTLYHFLDSRQKVPNRQSCRLRDKHN